MLSTFPKSIFLVFILTTGILTIGFAQRNCEDPTCLAEELDFRTGVDHATGNFYNVANPATDQDPYWRLVSAPSTPPVNVGGPPWVVRRYASSWHTDVNAKWLSAFPTAGAPAFVAGTYTFERCFCLCEDDDLDISELHVYADDEVQAIRIGGNNIPFTPAYIPNSIIHFNQGVTPVNGSVFLRAGRHCMQIDVQDTNDAAFGYKVEGSIRGAHLETSACCEQTSTISGFKFEDTNGNGIWDNSELPLENWQINLLDNGNIISSTLTDTTGYFTFGNVTPGTYELAEVQQIGYQQTFPPNGQSHMINITGIQAIVRNFGNAPVEVPPGEITGRKFHDLNCNGFRDSNEPYLVGWTFDLYDSNNNLVQSALSDPNGSFSFLNLAPGTYSVQEQAQTGWQQSFPTNGNAQTVTLQPNTSPYVEFGNCLVSDPDACCDDQSLTEIFKEDFETGAVNNANGYSLGSGQLPGEYAYLNSAQANTISGGGWDVEGYSSGGNCDPNDRFMAVNGRTNGTGEAEVYRSNLLNTQDGVKYSICAQFKHLPQCAFDVAPIVRMEVVYQSGFNGPFPLFVSPNTQVGNSSAPCDYMTISGTFTGIDLTALQGAYIRIFLDETGVGEGNDLVIDEILVQEVPVVPVALTEFQDSPILLGNGTYNMQTTVPNPLPPDCTARWEVYQVVDLNNPLVPISGTYMTGNTATGWGASTDFPGYDAPPGNAGIFYYNTNYVIRRIVDCECYEESAFISKFNRGPQGLIMGSSGPQEAFETAPAGKASTQDAENESDIIPELRLVPNPFQSTVRLEFPEASKQVTSWQVLDLSGRTLQTVESQAGSSSAELDLATLPAGTYIIRGVFNGLPVSRKAIKQ